MIELTLKTLNAISDRIDDIEEAVMQEIGETREPVPAAIAEMLGRAYGYIDALRDLVGEEEEKATEEGK